MCYVLVLVLIVKYVAPASHRGGRGWELTLIEKQQRKTSVWSLFQRFETMNAQKKEVWRILIQEKNRVQFCNVCTCLTCSKLLLTASPIHVQGGVVLLHLSSSCLFVHLRVIFPCRLDDYSAVSVFCLLPYFPFHPHQQGTLPPFSVVSFWR